MTQDRQDTRAVLDEREQAVMDHILAAMQGIQDFGLRTNTAELAQAVHVLQSFVIQHMLQRIAPGHWGAWFEEGEVQMVDASDSPWTDPIGEQP